MPFCLYSAKFDCMLEFLSQILYRKNTIWFSAIMTCLLNHKYSLQRKVIFMPLINKNTKFHKRLFADIQNFVACRVWGILWHVLNNSVFNVNSKLNFSKININFIPENVFNTDKNNLVRLLFK